MQNLERFKVSSARALQQEGHPIVDPPPIDWKPLPLALPRIRGGGKTEKLVQERAREATAASETSRRSLHPLDPDSWLPQPLRLLVGPPGVGKSVLLNYAVHYAVRPLTVSDIV